jgi:predicted small lipoprotein YifL
MEKIKLILLSVMLASGAAALAACDREGPLEEAGEEVDDAVDDAEDELDR